MGIIVRAARLKTETIELWAAEAIGDSYPKYSYRFLEHEKIYANDWR